MQMISPFSDPLRLPLKAHTLNDFLINSLGNYFHASKTHSIICLLEGALMLPCAVRLCSSLANHSLYMSRRYSLIGLFQLTSGAWMNLVQPPGTITASTLPWFKIALTSGVKCHRNASQAKSRSERECSSHLFTKLLG